MLTGPEEIIFPRAQPQDKIFIENSMKRTRAYRVKTASNILRIIEIYFYTDPYTVRLWGHSIDKRMV